MAVPAATVEVTINGVVIDVPEVVGLQTYDLAWISVEYSNSRLAAVLDTDYALELSEDYATVTITPRNSLINKIIAEDNGDVIFVRRDVPLTSDITENDVQFREKIVNEFDTLTMRDQQIAHDTASVRNDFDTFQEEFAEDVASTAANAAAALASEIAAELAETNAELARDIAAGHASTAAAQSNVPLYGTTVGMSSITVPVGLQNIETMGYSAVTDRGGVRAVRVATEPSHGGKFRSQDRFLPNGLTDSTNGGWWEFTGKSLSLRAYGCDPSGGTVDTQKIRDAFHSACLLDIPIVTDGTYKIDSNTIYVGSTSGSAPSAGVADNFALIGSPRVAFKPASGATTASVIIRCQDAKNVQFKHIDFDLSEATEGAGQLRFDRVDGAVVRDINKVNTGAAVTDGGSAVSIRIGCKHFNVSKVRVENAGPTSAGCFLNGVTDSYFEDIYCKDGQEVVDLGGCDRNTFVDIKGRDLTGDGVDVGSSSHNKFYGIDIEGCDRVVTIKTENPGTLDQRALVDPFTTTNGSAVVNVADSTFGLVDGSWVTFSGAAAVGGITINGTYQITIIDDDNYTITHGSPASSDAGPGGINVTANYLHAGSNDNFFENVIGKDWTDYGVFYGGGTGTTQTLHRNEFRNVKLHTRKAGTGGVGSPIGIRTVSGDVVTDFTKGLEFHDIDIKMNTGVAIEIGAMREFIFENIRADKAISSNVASNYQQEVFGVLKDIYATGDFSLSFMRRLTLENINIVGGKITVTDGVGLRARGIRVEDAPNDAMDIAFSNATIAIDNKDVVIRDFLNINNSLVTASRWGLRVRHTATSANIQGVHLDNCRIEDDQVTATSSGFNFGNAFFDWNSMRNCLARALVAGQSIVAQTSAYMLGENSVNANNNAGFGEYQEITTDAGGAFGPNVTPYLTRHSGTLTAARPISLSTSGAVKGKTKYKVVRTGGGAFALNVGTGPLKALNTGEWAEFTFDGTAYYVSEFGTL